MAGHHCHAVHGYVPSQRSTTSSRKPGKRLEGTVRVLPKDYRPLDWTQLAPLCPHGLHAQVCAGCGARSCNHPGALRHTCGAAAITTTPTEGA